MKSLIWLFFYAHNSLAGLSLSNSCPLLYVEGIGCNFCLKLIIFSYIFTIVFIGYGKIRRKSFHFNRLFLFLT